MCGHRLRGCQISDKAKENQILSGGAVPQKSVEPEDTQKELAKIASVLIRYYY
jgi:hypothetical protein